MAKKKIARKKPAHRVSRSASPVLAAPLKRGSTVALIAPAFRFDRNLLSSGRSFLESRYGIRTVMRDDIHEGHSYFAGTDARRIDELFQWLTDPAVDAVMAIRGGYGLTRIYPELIRRLKREKHLKPKIVTGYSDVTILLNGLFQDLGWITFHAPVVAGRVFQTPQDFELESFEKTLFKTDPIGEIVDPAMMLISEKAGSVRAPVVGGNLSLVVASIGTPYEVKTDGNILFLEDVDERPYRIDRMLTQLLHAGRLARVKGIVFGQMVSCDPAPVDRDPSQTVVLDAIKSALGPILTKVPVIYNFPSGHGKSQITFPVGLSATLRADASSPALIFERPATREAKK